MSYKNMPALINCFLSAYHYNQSIVPVTRDEIAEKLLGDDYTHIANSLIEEIEFFEPDFAGDDSDALYRVVNKYLAPPVVARNAFCDDALFVEKDLGSRQYLIFGAGYDTYAYRYWRSRKVNVFEIDRDELFLDKKVRVKAAKLENSKVNYISCDFEKEGWSNALLDSSYDIQQKAFCSFLGIAQYISKESFVRVLKELSSILPSGSGIAFDYHTSSDKVQTKLSEVIGKPIIAQYSYRELETLLSENGFRIYEHLNNLEITDKYFRTYNLLFPEKKIMIGEATAFCLAIRK